MSEHYVVGHASVENMVSLPTGAKTTSIMCLRGYMPEELVQAFTEHYGEDKIIERDTYEGKFVSRVVS
jgi:hypothetical protein